MKFKYKNITIPYYMYDQKDNYHYYIYKDKKYSDLNKLFTDFLGLYLTYHYEIKDNLEEVHNLREVVQAVVENPKSFKIPNKYKEEYSEDEYKYITELQKQLLNDKLKIYDNYIQEFKYSKNVYYNKKKFNFDKEIYEKYKNVKIPKKIHFKEYNKDYYVVAGKAFDSIFYALSEVYLNESYYQFGGTKNQNNRTHQHAHEFEEVVRMVFEDNTKFKIHVFQRQYYSKQELIFLEELSKKLKEMKFKSITRKYDKSDYEDYCYLRDNKKYIALLFHNIKFSLEDIKFRNEVLRSHKI